MRGSPGLCGLPRRRGVNPRRRGRLRGVPSLPRPALMVAGLGLCAAGVAVFLGAPPDDPRGFPALEDALILGGILLTVFAVGGAAPRGRQRLGRG